MWCRLKTKESAALECWFIGRPAQFNLSRLEGLGRDPQIEKAVQYLMDELRKSPPREYKRPPFPDYHTRSNRSGVPTAAN